MCQVGGARARGGDWESEASAQQEAEWLRFNLRDWECGENGRGQRAHAATSTWPSRDQSKFSAPPPACARGVVWRLCCQPYLGWFGSGSNSARGGVSTNSGNGGTTKPASTNNSWQVHTDWKHGPSSRSIPTINSLAIVGWRSLTIFMESAHDAQNAAVLRLDQDLPWTVASWQWPLQTEAQTGFPEHLPIMTFSKISRLFWSDRSEPENCPG